LWWWYINTRTNIMFLDIIHRPVNISKHNISETGFCLRPLVLYSGDRARFHLEHTTFRRLDYVSVFRKTEDGDRVQSPKRCVLTYKHDFFLDKNRMMDNLQKHNICTKVVCSKVNFRKVENVVHDWTKNVDRSRSYNL
jgi:hypothetical protein